MNKNIISLLCLSLIVVAVPSCRNCKKDKEPVQQEEMDMDTMIDLDTLVEESQDLDRKVSKF